MDKIDLHIHTKYSDGSHTLIEILQMTQMNDLKYISITDHDNIDVYEELKDLDVSKYYSGKIIPGIELKAIYNKTPIEVLGYNYDRQKLKQSKWVNNETKQNIQNIYLEKLKQSGKKLGLIFDDDLCIKDGNFANNTFYNEVIKCERNMEILNKMGITNIKVFYRDFVCNPNTPFYIDESEVQMSILEAVELIHSCGGIALLAHPLGTYCVENPEEFIKQIVNLGILDGLECMHSCITKEQSEFLMDLCNKNNLVMSGGSDFHREERNKLTFVNFGKEQIPLKLIDKLLEKIDIKEIK